MVRYLPALAFLLLLLTNGCGRLHDPRLTGTFQSDKEATLAYLRTTGKYTPEKLKKLGALFGKLKVTYGRNTALTELNGHVETEPLSVIEVAPAYAIVETTLPFMDNPVRYRLTFTEDGYWLSEGPLQDGFREKFTRIASQASATGGAEPATTEPGH